MKLFSQGIAVLAVAAFLAVANNGIANDSNWTGWRGGDRSARVADFTAPAEWPEELEKGWSVEVGTGHATPALVDGKLYVHARQDDDMECILALDAATGKELWRDALKIPYEMDPTATKHGKGPKSSVTVVDGRVFTFGITGVLSCLDAATGKILWRHVFEGRYPKLPRYGAAMSPIVHEGVLIAHVGGDGQGAITAFDVESGKEKWSWGGDGPGYASPIIVDFGGTKQLITQTQFNAVGLSPTDGKLLWKYDYSTTSDQNSVSPVVVGDILVMSGYHKGTEGFRLKEGKLEQAWKTSKASMYMSTPLVKGQNLIGFSEKRRGQYFCLDATSGDILWTGDGREGENAALVDVGSVILALNTASELVVFTAETEDYDELARYEVADSPTWAHPVVSGRTVYIKDETHLTRWSIPDAPAK